MTKTETVLRSIFGSCRSDIRPLAYAVDIAIELMFVQGIPMDDILVTNDIYPDVAKRIRKKSGAHPSAKSASRRIERLANKCWDAMVSRGLVVKYIGAPLEDEHTLLHGHRAPARPALLSRGRFTPPPSRRSGAVRPPDR